MDITSMTVPKKLKYSFENCHIGLIFPIFYLLSCIYIIWIVTDFIYNLLQAKQMLKLIPQ